MRRHLALLAAGAALASPSSALSRAEVAAAPARPNVVFVLADDLGYAELGSYGQQKIRTPSLDRLAAEGVRFTQHYSGNAVCAPSRSVLLTGRHPGHTPIRDNREAAARGAGAAARRGGHAGRAASRGQGYVTGGDRQVGARPARLRGRPAPAGLRPLLRLQLPAPGAQLLPDLPLRRRPPAPPRQPAVPGAPEAARRRRPGRPEELRRVRRPGLRARPHLGAGACVRPRQPGPSLLPLSPDDRAAPGAAGAGGLAGRVPRASGPTRRTAATTATSRTRRPAPPTRRWSRAWTARSGGSSTSSASWASTSGRSSSSRRDNGPTYDRLGGTDSEFFRSAGPLRGLKGSLYEGGVRVPAIVRWTGRDRPPALVSERVTGFEDWLPTLLELAGAKEAIPPGIDGLSFAPTLLGRAQEPRPFLYREFPGYGGQQSVRVGDWKGVRQGLGQPGPLRLELYDLKADVGETRDVSAEHPDVVAQMEALLAREHQPSSAFPLPAIDGETPRYVVARSPAAAQELLSGRDAAWSAAQRVTWGPEAIATSFRALWTADGLALRYDVTDPSPWHTLTRRDERLWNEEVVELFLDVGATGRSYAEIEWNPVNAVVDLWVDRPENRYDKEWDAAGLESRVHPRKDSAGRTTGWTVTSILPWRALAAKAPPGTALPPSRGTAGASTSSASSARAARRSRRRTRSYLAWSPTGHRSFHVPLAFREMVFAETPAPPRAAASDGSATEAPQHRVDRDRRPGLLGHGRLRQPRRAHARPRPPRPRGRRSSATPS